MPAPTKEISMNTVSASRAEGAAAAPSARRVLVWDAPVRVFHWLLVACFAGAWLTSESERWQTVHVTLGYTVLGLVVFRLLWGLVGSRHARFSSFVRGPSAVRRYLASVVRGRPEHHAGHNPAGALAIVGLLGLAACVTATGWATYNEFGGHALEELHEGLAATMLALAGVHVAGVVAGSWAHRENLVAAMITGRKLGTPQEAIARPWRGIAFLLFVMVLGFWYWQTA
jgi:cytochrome b